MNATLEDLLWRWERLCVLTELGTGMGALRALETALSEVAEDLTIERSSGLPAVSKGLSWLIGRDLARALEDALSTAAAPVVTDRLAELVGAVEGKLGDEATRLLAALARQAVTEPAQPLEPGLLGSWLEDSRLTERRGALVAAELRALLRRFATAA